MTRETIVAAALAAAAICGAAEINPQFDHYCDWKAGVVRVPTAVNGDDSRRHNDMSCPLHGPWLANPGPDTMSVAFQTACDCGAAIEYREKGTEKWTRQWRLVYGMIDFSDDLHYFHLKGLKSATTYEYRFVVASDRHLNAYAEPVIGRETWTFRTLDAAKRDFKVMVTSDLHGSGRNFLDYMYGRYGKDADLYAFLGDSVDDCMSQADFYVTSGFLDYAVDLWAKEKPSIFVRGNHDCWGVGAAKAWARWFERPDAKGYYTVRHGNALFIVFDVPDPYHMTQGCKEATLACVDEEKAWFAGLKKSPEWRASKWRIALCHYGTRCATGFEDSWLFRDTFAALLNGDDGTEPIDLLLCGDAHFYLRNLAHSKEYFHNTKYDRNPKKPYVFKPCKSADPNKDWRFAEVCHVAYTSISTLVIGEKTLKFTSHDLIDATAPKPLDEFVLEK